VLLYRALWAGDFRRMVVEAATVSGMILFILGSVVVLIVLGSLLEGLPALLILAPLLLPLAAQVGVSALHYGILLLIAMGIGAFAPPVGVGFYVACAVARTPLERSARAMLPYPVVLALGLLMVTLFPWFTLALPGALGLGR
jgi:TRAP-type C4-dicarboxylate transport system permease large subunit